MIVLHLWFLVVFLGGFYKLSGQPNCSFIAGYWVDAVEYRRIEQCQITPSQSWNHSGGSLLTFLDTLENPRILSYDLNESMKFTNDTWQTSSLDSYRFVIEGSDTLMIRTPNLDSSQSIPYTKIPSPKSGNFYGETWPVFMHCLQTNFTVGKLGTEMGTVQFHEDQSVTGLEDYDQYWINLTNSLPVMVLVNSQSRQHQPYVMNPVPNGFLLYDLDKPAQGTSSGKYLKATRLVYVFNRN